MMAESSGLLMACLFLWWKPRENLPIALMKEGGETPPDLFLLLLKDVSDIRDNKTSIKDYGYSD